MMKRFWWTLVGLRANLALCNSQHFNVYDDPYAYPQYTISWQLDYPVTEQEADIHLAPDSPAATSPIAQYAQLSVSSNSDEAEDLSIPTISGYENIIKQDQRYLCAIPYVAPSTGPDAPLNRTAEEEEKELALATQRGWELLKGMDGNCIYFISGWWSYSFCYNQGVRQFHPLPSGRNIPPYPPVEDKSVGAYVLGRFQGSEGPVEEEEEEVDDLEALKRRNAAKIKDMTKDETKGLGKLEVRGQTRYLVKQLGGGTVCDLTGEERSIEVQFRCDSTSTDRISLIKETSICQYRMVISTPRLCNDVAFHPPKTAKPNPINCHPVLNEEDLPGYAEKRKAESKTRKEEAEKFVNDIAKEVMDEFKAIIGGGSAKKSKGKDKKAKDFKAGDVVHDKVEKSKLSSKIIVGGIEFGGHNILPKGTKLPKGSVVSGGSRDKFVVTLAKSDGSVMKEEELKKLGLKNGAALEVVIDELKRDADGAEWTIDLYETARGREIRGIIDDSRSKDGAKAEKQKKTAKSAAKDEHAQDQERQTHFVHDDDDDDEEGSEETYKEEL